MAADGSYIPANVSRESWIVGTPEYLAMMRLRKIWAEGSFSVLKREHCISRIRKRGILAATEECLLAAMALNLKRMVNAIFRYPQIYYSAGATMGFSSFFAFVNRAIIVLDHFLLRVQLPLGVHGQDFLLNVLADAGLVLFQHLRLKFS